MRWLWLLPDSLLPLIVVGLAIAVMLRRLSVGSAVLIIAVLTLAPVLIDGLVDAAIEILPLWLIVLVLAVLVVRTLQMVASLVIGDRAADEMTGSLAASFVLGCLRLLVLPFRLVGRLFRRLLAAA